MPDEDPREPTADDGFLSVVVRDDLVLGSEDVKLFQQRRPIVRRSYIAVTLDPDLVPTHGACLLGRLVHAQDREHPGNMFTEAFPRLMCTVHSK